MAIGLDTQPSQLLIQNFLCGRTIQISYSKALIIYAEVNTTPTGATRYKKYRDE
jgi:hypothetical protein